MLGPVVGGSANGKANHVRHLHRVALGAEGKAHALERAEQVEVALGAHGVEHLIAREIVDLDDEPGAQIAKFLRQAAKPSPARTSSSTGEGAFIRPHASGSDTMPAMTGLVERFAPGVPIDPCGRMQKLWANGAGDPCQQNHWR